MTPKRGWNILRGIPSEIEIESVTSTENTIPIRKLKRVLNHSEIEILNSSNPGSIQCNQYTKLKGNHTIERTQINISNCPPISILNSRVTIERTQINRISILPLQSTHGTHLATSPVKYQYSIQGYRGYSTQLMERVTILKSGLTSKRLLKHLNRNRISHIEWNGNRITHMVGVLALIAYIFSTSKGNHTILN